VDAQYDETMREISRMAAMIAQLAQALASCQHHRQYTHPVDKQ